MRPLRSHRRSGLRRFVGLIGASAVLLGACGGDESSSPSTERPAADVATTIASSSVPPAGVATVDSSTDDAGPAEETAGAETADCASGRSGPSVETVEGSDGRLRTFHVRPPAGRHPERLPVVFDLHALGGSAEYLFDAGAWNTIADQQGILLVYPQGTSLDGPTFWNAGPIEPGGSRAVDDVDFLLTVLDRVESMFCVDADRVYATGYSLGGNMVSFLACRAGGRIAAVVTNAGLNSGTDGCTDRPAAPLLHVYGAEDPLTDLETNRAAVASWAEANGCGPEPMVSVPAETIGRIDYPDCAADTSWIVAEGMGHRRLGEGDHPAADDDWKGPANLEIQAADLAWQWFADHPMASPRADCGAQGGVACRRVTD